MDDDTVIEMSPSSSNSNVPDVVTKVKAYVLEHNGGFHITKKSDLWANTMSTKNFDFVLPNAPKDSKMILIFSDNPIFKIMNAQTNGHWSTKEWICGQYFPMDRHDTSNLMTTSSQMRFGSNGHLNPLKIIGSLFSKNLENILSSVTQPQEFMLYLVDEEAFDAICTVVYEHILKIKTEN